MRLAVIFPAAGASSRFGDGNKLDADLAGRPVVQRTVELFVKREEVSFLVVAGPAGEAQFTEFRERHGDKLGLMGVLLCRGGKTHRWETVREALRLVPGDVTHIAVHDGARPCTPPELIDRVLLAARKRRAVIPALEVGDTLKRVEERREERIEVDPLAAILGGPSGPSGRSVRVVEETVSREGLALVQTPQVFEAETLRKAYAQGDLTSTDDSALVERLFLKEGHGERVLVVEGDARNIKITRRGDVGLAMRILGLREEEGRAAHKKF